MPPSAIRRADAEREAPPRAKRAVGIEQARNIQNRRRLTRSTQNCSLEQFIAEKPGHPLIKRPISGPEVSQPQVPHHPAYGFDFVCLRFAPAVPGGSG